MNNNPASKSWTRIDLSFCEAAIGLSIRSVTKGYGAILSFYQRKGREAVS
jgi:hypothetical protein